MHKKTIDPVTGRLFMRHSLMDDARDKARREAKRITDHMDDEYDPEYKEALKMTQNREKIVREMSLDEGKLIPNTF
jgi:vacuolar-type H+-ATPase subunit E/Vma4